MSNQKLVGGIHKMKKSRSFEERRREEVGNLREQFAAFPESIPAIRLLPMSGTDPEFEGKTVEEVQDWFRYTLPGIDYNFKNGMDTPAGSLILFQFKGSVIALAILKNKYLHPASDKGSYRGAYQFNSSSIAVVDPIHFNDMQEIWSELKSFNQSSQKLDVRNYQLFLELLSTKNFRFVEYQSEEDFQQTVEKVKISVFKVEDKPKALIQTRDIVSQRQSWSRNPLTAKRAIASSNSTCEIDQTHKFFTSFTTGLNYVEAHHLIPMEYQMNFEKSLDVESNIISLCALCHKKIHHATMAEKTPMIEKLYEMRKERLGRCELNTSIEELLEMYI